MNQPFYWVTPLTEVFLNNGYLSPGETAQSRVRDIANHAESLLNLPGFADKFYHYVGQGYYSLSSPVWSNFGKARGLPVSCFSSYCTDSVPGILKSQAEIGAMSKLGGGTGIYLGALRPRGADITDNGKSTGTVHFMELFQATTDVISQGSQRRGRTAAYLPIDHGDIDEFLKVSTEGHPVQNMLTAVVISDDWMESMLAGDQAKRTTWGKLLKARSELGYPYLMFSDNANKHKPDVYKDKQLRIHQSNLCVTGDTRILTREGYKPIQSLAGQTVECWNGSNWSPTPIFQTSEGQEVLEVLLSNGHTIKATPYHKWYVAKQDTRGKLVGEVMKRTFELQPDDKLVKYDLEPVTHGTKELPHAYANGFHTADGTVHSNGSPRISLYGNKKDLVDKFTGYRSITADSYNRLNVNYGSEVLQDKFFVPSAEHSVESRLQWLAGLFDGDGTLTNNNGTESIQLVSINKPFLLELQLLLQELGVDAKISLMSEAGYRKLPANDGTGELKDFWCKESYRIMIAGSYLNHLVSLGLPTSRVVPTTREYNRKATQFVKVVSVTDNNEVAPTYCGTEPEYNKLMFNGVLTGNCNEIYLPTSSTESLVCVLSSMNILHYDSWKDTDAVETLVYFLDAVVTDFLHRLESYRDSSDPELQEMFRLMERSYTFAKRHRALGVGTLGYASYLQSKLLAFESREAAKLNLQIHKLVHDKAYQASRELAQIYGEPELLTGYGRRNTTLLAIAPTTSSAFILGQVSQSIEPIWSNYYVKDVAKAKVPMKNPYLQAVLAERGYDTPEVWQTIANLDGSVYGLSDDILPPELKQVFRTFREINQEAIIDQAAVRQEYIDQGQSLNVMITTDLTPKEISQLHIRAWQQGLKGMYYQHSVNQSQEFARQRTTDCLACHA